MFDLALYSGLIAIIGSNLIKFGFSLSWEWFPVIYLFSMLILLPCLKRIREGPEWFLLLATYLTMLGKLITLSAFGAMILALLAMISKGELMSLGMLLIGVGVVSNLTVMEVNGGMPVVIKEFTEDFKPDVHWDPDHCPAEGARLLFLADRFYVEWFPLEFVLKRLRLKRYFLAVADGFDLGNQNAKTLAFRFGLGGGIISIGDVLLLMGIWGMFLEAVI